MLAELEAADPGQDQGVVGGEPAGGLERLRGRRVERRIGRLADALEERETEVALGVGVGRVGGDERLEPGDLGDGRRGRARAGELGGRRRAVASGVVDSAAAIAAVGRAGGGDAVRGRRSRR